MEAKDRYFRFQCAKCARPGRVCIGEESKQYETSMAELDPYKFGPGDRVFRPETSDSTKSKLFPCICGTREITNIREGAMLITLEMLDEPCYSEYEAIYTVIDESMFEAYAVHATAEHEFKVYADCDPCCSVQYTPEAMAYLESVAQARKIEVDSGDYENWDDLEEDYGMRLDEHGWPD